VYHLIEAQQFTKKDLRRLFDLSHSMEQIAAIGDDCMKYKILCSLFYVPSIRTRFSFESAMIRIGGKIIGTEEAKSFSSEVPGNFDDTIRVVSALTDIIVLRHQTEGSARRASELSQVPIINAGDGKGQHPTQALLDLYTIDHHLGGIDGCSIAFIGDLDSRCIRTLSYFLAKYDAVKIHFLSPDVSIKVKDDIKGYLNRHNVQFTEIMNLGTNLKDIVKNIDVLYCTQLTSDHFVDRFDDYGKAKRGYVIDASVLSYMRRNALIMHPLPRSVELPASTDDDPRSVYLRQTSYGLHIRMAILCTVLDIYPHGVKLL
jgi:aspartate carbamoyltransferase catalytic subunit